MTETLAIKSLLQNASHEEFIDYLLQHRKWQLSFSLYFQIPESCLFCTRQSDNLIPSKRWLECYATVVVGAFTSRQGWRQSGGEGTGVLADTFILVHVHDSYNSLQTFTHLSDRRERVILADYTRQSPEPRLRVVDVTDSRGVFKHRAADDRVPQHRSIAMVHCI